MLSNVKREIKPDSMLSKTKEVCFILLFTPFNLRKVLRTIAPAKRYVTSRMRLRTFLLL